MTETAHLHASVSGTGAPVALLHGLFGASGNFGALQRRLAARYRVIALDLRNHGASPHRDDMAYDDMAADVLETLARIDARPAVLIGHSMGGKVAMRAAVAHQAAVTALLVSDIAPVHYAPAFRTLAAALQAIPLRPGLRRAEADALLAQSVPEPGLRAFLLSNLKFGEAPHWRIGLDRIAHALPRIEDWPVTDKLYTGPALFVSGARSGYVTPEHRPAIRALFPAARFATVKDAGHWIHADQPEAFAAICEAFLGRICATP